MSKVILDDVLRSKLNGLTEHLEVCDDSGHTLGHFLTDDQYHQLLYASDQCPYTEEELQHSLKEPGGRTLAEIWKSLGVS